MKRLLALLPLALATACETAGPSTATSLQALNSCEDVERVVRKRLLEKMYVEVDTARDAHLARSCTSYDYGFGDDSRLYGVSPAPEATGATSTDKASSGEPNTGASEYSGTNNQVQGVDEADFIKNDARYFYVVSNGALHVLDAYPPETATVLARLKLDGTPLKLFVEDGRAVVFARKQGPYRSAACTYGYDCELTGEPGPTLVHFIDLRDLTSPKVTKSFEFAGGLLAARRVGRTVYTAVSFEERMVPGYVTHPPNLPSCVSEADVPRVTEVYEQLKEDNRIRLAKADLGALIPSAFEVGGGSLFGATCDGFYESNSGDGARLTSVFAFDLEGSSTLGHASVIGRPGAVFANERSLYVTAREKQTTPETSAVHRFALSGAEVRYAGSSRVQGHVLNQFSMDEFDGHLRVATSIGRVPDSKVNSAVTIFDARSDGALTQTGVVAGIAPTEDIRSVRFVGERGYLVTFKKTDPLFTLDLKDPAAPRVTGELKIPGFSTYMHPIGSTHLLAIGFEAEDRGSFAYFQGLQLQFFDVRDPASPTLLHKEVIGTRGSASEAATNHLAFNYFASKNLLALPMAICEGSSGGSSYGRLTFDGLLVFRASVETGFERLGGVAHSEEEDAAAYAANPRRGKCSTWWSSSSTHVQRSVFMDDVVYSVAADEIRVQRLGALGTNVSVLSLKAP